MGLPGHRLKHPAYDLPARTPSPGTRIRSVSEKRELSSCLLEFDQDTGRLTGDLSVRGVTQPVTLDVTINSAAMNPLNRKEMIGFSATGTLRRSDYGLTAYTPMVSDELSLAVQVEFEKSK